MQSAFNNEDGESQWRLPRYGSVRLPVLRPRLWPVRRAGGGSPRGVSAWTGPSCTRPKSLWLTQRTSLDSALGVVCPGEWPGGRDDAELAAHLVVGGVVDHVARVGVDAGEAGDLAVDSGLLESLADPGGTDGLTYLDGSAGQCPSAVVVRRMSRITPSSRATPTESAGTMLLGSGAAGSS
jgi:hypothetical protein